MAVNRERKIVRKPVESFDIPCSTLKSIQETLSRAIATYGDDAIVDWHEYPYDDSKYLYVYANLPETDEEMAKRIAQEEQWAAVQEKREREEFARLQQKFGEKK